MPLGRCIAKICTILMEYQSGAKRFYRKHLIQRGKTEAAAPTDKNSHAQRRHVLRTPTRTPLCRLAACAYIHSQQEASQHQSSCPARLGLIGQSCTARILATQTCVSIRSVSRVSPVAPCPQSSAGLAPKAVVRPMLPSHCGSVHGPPSLRPYRYGRSSSSGSGLRLGPPARRALR